MAKKNSFKMINNMHLENVSDSDWSSFLRIEKQNPAMRSAWVEKVRISYVWDTESSAPDYGALFVASYDKELDSSTAENNDGQMIATSASRGGAGVVTLSIDRRITINYDGSDADNLSLLEGTGGAPIYLHLHKAKTGGAQDCLLAVEVYGRWLSTTAL